MILSTLVLIMEDLVVLLIKKCAVIDETEESG